MKILLNIKKYLFFIGSISKLDHSIQTLKHKTESSRSINSENEYSDLPFDEQSCWTYIVYDTIDLYKHQCEQIINSNSWSRATIYICEITNI